MKDNKGFTFLELLVIIAIAAISAAVVIPNLMKTLEQSKNTPITVTAPPVTITTTRPPRETITITPTITVYKDSK